MKLQKGHFCARSIFKKKQKKTPNAKNTTLHLIDVDLTLRKRQNANPHSNPDPNSDTKISFLGLVNLLIHL